MSNTRTRIYPPQRAPLTGHQPRPAHLRLHHRRPQQSTIPPGSVKVSRASLPVAVASNTSRSTSSATTRRTPVPLDIVGTVHESITARSRLPAAHPPSARPASHPGPVLLRHPHARHRHRTTRPHPATSVGENHRRSEYALTIQLRDDVAEDVSTPKANVTDHPGPRLSIPWSSTMRDVIIAPNQLSQEPTAGGPEAAVPSATAPELCRSWRCVPTNTISGHRNWRRHVSRGPDVPIPARRWQLIVIRVQRQVRPKNPRRAIGPAALIRAPSGSTRFGSAR
jgi:hypothetical protein